MKVILLTQPIQWGGAEVYTIALANALVQRGHAVTLVDLGSGDYQRWVDPGAGFPVLHPSRPGRLSQFSLRQCLALLRPLPGDVALFVKGVFGVGSWRFDLAARLRYGRYLTMEQCIGDPIPPRTRRRHRYGLPGLGLWWYRLRLDCYLRSLGPRRVICVSDAVKRRLVQDYYFPARKTLTVHNGIDTDRFRPSEESRRILRAGWGIPEAAFLFGAVARLECSHKQQDLAITLFAKLRALTPERDPWLVLVGQGPDEALLRELARTAGVDHRVHFAGFWGRTWEAYCALDAHLLPSRLEGLPLALIEAMACGCCPIAMAVGGVPEVLTDPELGWLIAPDDDQGFLAAMREVLEAGPERRAEMGRRARQHVVAHFNSRVQLVALAEVLEAQRSGIRGKNS